MPPGEVRGGSLERAVAVGRHSQHGAQPSPLGGAGTSPRCAPGAPPRPAGRPSSQQLPPPPPPTGSRPGSPPASSPASPTGPRKALPVTSLDAPCGSTANAATGSTVRGRRTPVTRVWHVCRAETSATWGDAVGDSPWGHTLAKPLGAHADRGPAGPRGAAHRHTFRAPRGAAQNAGQRCERPAPGCLDAAGAGVPRNATRSEGPWPRGRRSAVSPSLPQ